MTLTQWVQSINEATINSATAEARFSEPFNRIESQLEKLSGLSKQMPDWQQVSNDSIVILTKHSKDLLEKLDSLMNTQGPVLCEIMGKENQDYIMTHYAKNIENRLVRRPIEDQAPFIDRDLFLSEMIVDPIDQ